MFLEWVCQLWHTYTVRSVWMLSQEVTEPRARWTSVVSLFGELDFGVQCDPTNIRTSLFRMPRYFELNFLPFPLYLPYFELSLNFELFFVSPRVWNNRVQTVLVLFVTGQFRRGNIITKAQKMNLRDIPFSVLSAGLLILKNEG